MLQYDDYHKHNVERKKLEAKGKITNELIYITKADKTTCLW